MTPKIILVDNGTKYINADLITWCKDKGIKIQQTAPYSPQQNGMSERLNQTLMELARAMLIARKMPEYLWAEAVSHTTYLRNQAPTHALQGTTPEGLWNQKLPDVSHLQEFSAPVYILSKGMNKSKLAAAKSMKHIFVGFTLEGAGAIKYYNASTRQVKVSRNYRFLNNPVLQHEGETDSEDTLAAMGLVDAQYPEAEVVPMVDTRNEAKRPRSESEQEPRKSKRQTVRHNYQALHDPEPDWTYLDHQSGYTKEELSNIQSILSAVADNDNQNNGDPKTLHEAQASAEWPKWEEAIRTELTQLEEMGTWELADKPKEQTLVGNKWVFMRKTNKEGEVIKYKARLVTKGYSQKPGMEYNETFAPVVCLETIRSVMSTAALLDWEIQQMDIKGAYLNGIIKEEVYMAQPEGFDDGTG